jgi:hypothetical protein
MNKEHSMRDANPTDRGTRRIRLVRPEGLALQPTHDPEPGVPEDRGGDACPCLALQALSLSSEGSRSPALGPPWA